jgi:ubiquinone/menaquinone biosynthesis C-methylase UbiE
MPIQGSGFTDVDRTADPAHFVDILDVGSQLWGDIRRQTYAALAVRAGDRLLDVGCGMGDAVRELAELVGDTGQVVGVDSSRTMVAEARWRSRGVQLPVEYRLGDVYALGFADDTFDGCRAQRIFVHLERPAEALAEMRRVTRPGGRIVITEPDMEARLVDAPDRDLTRRILNNFCDTLVNGWIGRQLPRLFEEAGLTDIAVSPRVLTQTDFRWGIAGLNSLSLDDHLARAQAGGVVSAAEATTWVRQLREASEAGHLFSAALAFMVSGRKP